MLKRSVVPSRRGLASRDGAASEGGGRKAGSEGSTSPFAFRPPNGMCLDTSEATDEVNLIAREMDH